MATPDDYSDDLSTTGVLLAGGFTKGILEVGGDRDRFKTTLQAGTTYLLSISGAAQDAGTLADFSQIYIVLIGANGGFLASLAGTSTGMPGALQFTATSTGVYYAQVNSNAGAYLTPGSYTLSLGVPAADDFSANVNTTGAFDSNGVAKGVFEQRYDQDWFKFHAEAGQHYSFALSTASGARTTIDRAIYDAGGKLVTNTTYPFEPVAGGDYFIALSSVDMNAYTVTKSLLVDDYSANDASPGLLAPGTQLTGALQYSGDIDRFKVTVEAGKFYTYQLTGNLSDQQYLQLSLTDDGGKAVASEPFRGDNGALTVTFAPTKSGTYSLNLSAAYTLPDGVTHGNYTLQALAAAADDYGNTAATATMIAVGSVTNGMLQASGDIDAFNIALQAGVTYDMNLSATGIAATGINRLNMLVMDPDGVTISAVNSGAVTHSFTPTVSGTYTLRATQNYNGILPLTYALTTGLSADDYGAAAASAGTLTLGTSLKAALETDGDRDWFGVGLDAGVTYWLTLAGNKEGAGTLKYNFDGETVKLFDAGGTLVAQARGDAYVTAPVLSFVPATKGTYYMEVSSPNHDKGTYTVQASVGVADDTGNDAAHASAIAAGVPVTAALEVTRDTDVFKFHAEAGRTYAFELNSAGVDSNGLRLSLAYSTGVSPSNARDFSVGNKIYRLFDSTSANDIYLSVAATPGGKAAQYTIAATVVTDDYAANALTTGVLTPGTPTQGVINYADDRDWIKLHFNAGVTYVLDLHGSLGGGGGLDTVTSGAAMSLFNAAGYTIAGQPVTAIEPRIAYIAAATGDYFVEVRGNSTHTGSYTLTETQTSGDVIAPTLTGGPAITDVGLLGNIVLSFSEAIQIGAGVVLKDGTGAVVALAPVVNGGVTSAIAIGSTLVINPLKYLAAGTTYTVALPDGGVMDLAGNHYAGPQAYTFTTQGAVDSGGSGNDILMGKGTGLALVGGAGTDTATYGGVKESYEIKIVGEQATVKASGALAGDTLTGVERVLFDITAIALDIAGNGGQAYRLYQAAFNRTPDRAGVGYWMSALDKGMSLHDVAGNFVASAEFTTLYGAAPADAALVGLLYSNVLHRTGDTDGNAYWLQVLHDGASRADVLAAFSESAENQAALVGVIGNGFAYTPYVS